MSVVSPLLCLFLGHETDIEWDTEYEAGLGPARVEKEVCGRCGYRVPTGRDEPIERDHDQGGCDTSDSNTVWLAYHGTHRASTYIVGVFDTEKEAEAALEDHDMMVRNYETVKEMAVGEVADFIV